MILFADDSEVGFTDTGTKTLESGTIDSKADIVILRLVNSQGYTHCNRSPS